MKAVYIPHVFDTKTDLAKLNEDLKQSYNVLKEIGVNNETLTGGISNSGTILIVDEKDR